ncbi:MAG: hypothetical protein IKJ74_07055 [Clostridia bacterium]|nr:hypothetical protein [Clostridia bacterium]
MKGAGLFSFFLFALPLYLLLRTGSLSEVGLFLLAALIHEAGHLFAAIALGYRPKGFLLTPAGASLRLDLSLAPYRKEVLIHSAGPVANGTAMLVTFLFLRFHFSFLLLYFFFCNGLFLFFNLMPVKGLDGYQALHAALSLRRDEETAERFLLPLHRLFFVFIALLGIWALIRFHNASLLVFSFLEILEGQTKKATRIS